MEFLIELLGGIAEAYMEIKMMEFIIDVIWFLLRLIGNLIYFLFTFKWGKFKNKKKKKVPENDSKEEGEQVYISPSSVVSPVKEIKRVMVLSDEGEGRASIALLEKDGCAVLAIRTNGTSANPLGEPKSPTGKPLWFIVPENMREGIIVNLIADNREEIRLHISQILKRDKGLPFRYVFGASVKQPMVNLIIYAIVRDYENSGIIKVLKNDDAVLYNDLVALQDGKYSFAVSVDHIPVPVK